MGRSQVLYNRTKGRYKNRAQQQQQQKKNDPPNAGGDGNNDSTPQHRNHRRQDTSLTRRHHWYASKTAAPAAGAEPHSNQAGAAAAPASSRRGRGAMLDEKLILEAETVPQFKTHHHLVEDDVVGFLLGAGGSGGGGSIDVQCMAATLQSMPLADRMQVPTHIAHAMGSKGILSRSNIKKKDETKEDTAMKGEEDGFDETVEELNDADPEEHMAFSPSSTQAVQSKSTKNPTKKKQQQQQQPKKPPATIITETKGVLRNTAPAMQQHAQPTSPSSPSSPQEIPTVLSPAEDDTIFTSVEVALSGDMHSSPVTSDVVTNMTSESNDNTATNISVTIAATGTEDDDAVSYSVGAARLRVGADGQVEVRTKGSQQLLQQGSLSLHADDPSSSHRSSIRPTNSSTRGMQQQQRSKRGGRGLPPAIPESESYLDNWLEEALVSGEDDHGFSTAKTAVAGSSKRGTGRSIRQGQRLRSTDDNEEEGEGNNSQSTNRYSVDPSHLPHHTSTLTELDSTAAISPDKNKKNTNKTKTPTKDGKPPAALDDWLDSVIT